MPEARNVAAIKRWVAENRPDLTGHFAQIIDGPMPNGDAFILLMTTCFEAGRMFQSETTEPARYVPMEELY